MGERVVEISDCRDLDIIIIATFHKEYDLLIPNSGIL